MKKLFSSLFIVLALACSVSSMAQDTASKGKHGGVILSSGVSNFEVKSSSGSVTFYPLDANSNEMRTKQPKADIDVLYMGEQNSVSYKDVACENGAYTVFTDNSMIPWIFSIRTVVDGKVVEQKLRMPNNGRTVK